MAISRFFTTPCTIVTPSIDPSDSSTDAEGVPAVVADTVETTCHVQPLSQGDASELVLGGQVAARARRVWFPPDTVLRFTSTVTIGFDRYEVFGDPDQWNVGSVNDHITAVLVRQLSPAQAAGESA